MNVRLNRDAIPHVKKWDYIRIGGSSQNTAIITRKKTFKGGVTCTLTPYKRGNVKWKERIRFFLFKSKHTTINIVQWIIEKIKRN